MSANAIIQGTLTSTTAPGKVFNTRSELAQHYKSDWHKYNLKRREAALPLLNEKDFTARWEAALALRNEKQKQSEIAGKDHLKKKNNKNKKKLATAQQSKQDARDGTSSAEENAVTDVPAEPKIHPKETAESQENPEINPLQSLFDSHVSTTLEENVKYMEQKYGFFLPDRGM